MNRFREWLSDNLRYILLIIGILGVLVALFFGVRAVSRGIGRDSGEPQVTSSIVTLAADLSAAEPAESAAESVVDTALAEDAVPEVTTLMTSYYNARSAGNVEAVRELVDTLSADDEEEIETATVRYTDLRVYTKPGNVTGSYVVYSRYQKRNDGETVFYPGLEQAYVAKDTTGELQIILSDVDQTTADYIEQVTAEEDVQALIEEVNQQYDAAVKAAATTVDESETTDGNPVIPDTIEASDEQSDGDNQTEADTDTSDEGGDENEAGAENQNEEEADGDNNDAGEEPANELVEDSDREEETYAEEEAAPSHGSIKSSVNVRSGPGFDYSVLTTVSGGTEVTVLGYDRGWYHITYSGVEGYVGHSYIDVW